MRGRGRIAADVVGIMLAAALALLALLRTPAGDDPAVAMAVAVAVVAFALGRVLGIAWRGIVPLAVVGAAVWIVFTDELGGGPLSGPFGYRNATGAFLILGAIAALTVGAAVPWERAKAAALVAALPVAAYLAWKGIGEAAAGGAALLALLPATFALLGARGVRAGVALAAVGFVLVLGGTIVLGNGYDGDETSVAARALTERRLVLWQESLDIIGREPGGVGSGRFAEESPTARVDQDARRAHHEFLEQGVELGWAGLALTVLLFLWGFARLWMHPDPDAVVALGAATLAAGGIHASVDYVLHFPAIAIALAALVGSAQAVPLRKAPWYGVDGYPREEGDEVGGPAAGPLRPSRTG